MRYIQEQLLPAIEILNKTVFNPDYAPSKGLTAVWYAVGPPFFIRHGVFFFDVG